LLKSHRLLGQGSEEQARYAKVILRDHVVRKTPDMLAEIAIMAENIYNCPRRRGDRTLEQVYRSSKKSVMDRALCEVAGFRWNSSDFDVTDPETYYYDAEDTQRGCRFEVKSLKEKWLSWKGRKPMATFLKHKDDIDYLVGGKLWESEDDFRVSFMLLARAKSFDKFIAPSDWGGHYYNHIIAGRSGQAIYREDF
jgi:hypothetical protein